MTKSTEHFSLTIISDCNELENVSNHWFSSRKCFIFKVHKKVPGFGKNLEWKNETFLDIFTHRVKVLPPSFFHFQIHNLLCLSTSISHPIFSLFSSCYSWKLHFLNLELCKLKILSGILAAPQNCPDLNNNGRYLVHFP